MAVHRFLLQEAKAFIQRHSELCEDLRLKKEQRRIEIERREEQRRIYNRREKRALGLLDTSDKDKDKPEV